MPSTSRTILFAAFLGVGGILTLLSGCRTPATQNSFNPYGLFREIGYEDAVRLSANQKKPMLLFFSNNWSKDREKLVARTLADDATLQLLDDRTIGLQIEMTDLPDIAKKHRAAQAPLLILVAPDGRELKRWKGLPRPEPFANDLATLLQPSPAGPQVAEAPAASEHPDTENKAGRF